MLSGRYTLTFYIYFISETDAIGRNGQGEGSADFAETSITALSISSSLSRARYPTKCGATAKLIIISFTSDAPEARGTRLYHGIGSPRRRVFVGRICHMQYIHKCILHVVTSNFGDLRRISQSYLI